MKRFPQRLVRAAGIAALTLAGCSGSIEPPSTDLRPAAEAGRPAPQAAGETPAPESPSAAAGDAASGRVHVEMIDGPGLAALIEENRGRVVLVDFWATWCSSCLEQFPHTVELHDRLAERGLSVISVSLNEPEEQEAVLEFLRSRSATMSNYISRHGGSDKSMEQFDLEGGLPHYKLYDREGKLLRTFAPGTEDPDPHEIDAAVESMLGDVEG